MPRIKIIVVGNTKSSFLKQGEAFYLERLQRYAPTEWVEVAPQKVKKGRSREEILRLEGRSIEKKCLQEEHVIALDLQGKAYDSEGLAGLIERLRPDVLTKGSNYKHETVFGHEIVEKHGGRIVLIPIDESISATGIINKIKNG